LLVHLRMSGDLLLGRKNKNLGKYSRLRILFENGPILSFNDARKFGRVWLIKDPQEIFAKLGPEPLGDDLSPAEFFANLQKRKRQLKPLLLDQSFIAGIGNIYADEALHRAKLHPLSSAHRLTRIQSNKLLRSIRYVLEEGIRRNGASIDWVYRGGEFQNHFKAYQRTGEKCFRCGREITRIVVGQRGTHFCPNCQLQA
jgi:formamidopyrimidine-DNA glycosylase